MKKRNLFAEKSEGLEPLKHERVSTITLSKHVIEATPLPQDTSTQSASPLR